MQAPQRLEIGDLSVKDRGAGHSFKVLKPGMLQDSALGATSVAMLPSVLQITNTAVSSPSRDTPGPACSSRDAMPLRIIRMSQWENFQYEA